MKITISFTICILVTLAASCGGEAISDNAATPISKPTVVDDLEWRNIPRFESLTVSDEKTYWVVSKKDRDLICSRDGGLTWNVVRRGVLGVTFVDATHGWLVDESRRLWATEDAGARWVLRNPKLEVSSFSEVEFTDRSTGWILDAFDLIQSKDGGLTWERSLSYEKKKPKAKPGGHFFLNNEKGWVCDGGDFSGTVHSTINGGQDWIGERVAKQALETCSLFFVNDSDGWFSLGPKQVYRTHDGGTTWNNVPSIPSDFNSQSIYFRNENEGYVAGYFQGEKETPMFGKGALLRTTDGGRNWEEVKLPFNAPFFSKVYSPDEEKLLLFSREKIYISEDDGKSWFLSFHYSDR